MGLLVLIIEMQRKKKMMKVGALTSVLIAVSVSVNAGSNRQGELPTCADNAITAKANEALTAWFRGTGIDWQGSSYQKQMKPALDRLKEKNLEKSAEFALKRLISTQISSRITAIEPSKIKLRFCDALVEGIWVQTMLILDPLDEGAWGMVVQSNISNLKFVPAPGFASIIFLN